VVAVQVAVVAVAVWLWGTFLHLLPLQSVLLQGNLAQDYWSLVQGLTLMLLREHQLFTETVAQTMSET
jgi:hypothetical protein